MTLLRAVRYSLVLALLAGMSPCLAQKPAQLSSAELPAHE
jgi:hypothetical protein